MKNKGFTLIELLAIILLLSFLAILIFPNLISNFEKKEVEVDQATKDILYSSADQYMERYGNDYDKQIGVIYDILISDIDKEGLIPIDVSKYIDKCIEVKIGNTNSYRIVECPDRSIVDLKDIYSSNNVKQKGVKGIAYFNPSDIDEVCDEENSTVGSGTSGCMKWYIFDNSGDNYKMILDHNTENSIAWNSSNTNVAYELSGAYEAIQNLNWDSSLGTTLITTSELNKIIGRTEFDITDVNSGYYFDSLTTTQRATSKGSSAYSWLYDYTYDCVSNGCEIASSDSTNGGYWTQDPLGLVQNYVYTVWYIRFNGSLNDTRVYTADVGIRPVITVPKNKFQKI